MRIDLVLPLNLFLPEVKEFSHTRINYAKPFVPSFEDEGLTSILYIEKGNFEIHYETGEVLTPMGGMFYYHPPLSLKYQTYDKMITPYSMFLLAIDITPAQTPNFSSRYLDREIIGQLPSAPLLRKAPPLLVSSFNTIVDEYEQKNHGWMVQIENSIRQILISAIRAANVTEQYSEQKHWLVERVDQLLDADKTYMGPVEDLFEQLGVKKSRGYDIFHQSTGLSPKEYVIRKKIEFAKLMLLQQIDITTIAFTLGFSSSQSFATVFKKLTCSTPSDFRKHHIPA